MQYDAGQILTYKRVEGKQTLKREKDVNSAFAYKEVLFYFFTGLLISRVQFINIMAPFGIGYLMALTYGYKEKYKYFGIVGCFIGYITIYKTQAPIYFILMATIVLINYMIKNLEENKKVLITFCVVLGEICVYRLVFDKNIWFFSLMCAFLEIICTMSVYYISRKALYSTKNLKLKKMLTQEENISIAVGVAMVVAGTYGFVIKGTSITNIIAFMVLILIGFSKGAENAAMFGIAMGTIIGINSNNMALYIGLYAVCGLISGLFKEGGKFLVGISFFTTFIMIKLYSNIVGYFNVMEALVPVLILIAIPVKFLDKIKMEMCFYDYNISVNKAYIDKVQDLAQQSIGGFKKVLNNLVDSLERLSENDNLALQSKSSALIQNLADRTCANCAMQSVCWKRESFYTYNSFSEFIEGYLNKTYEIPSELEEKCSHIDELKGNIIDIVDKHTLNEMSRTILYECKKKLQSQIINTVRSLDDLETRLGVEYEPRIDIERELRRCFIKKDISFKNITCLSNKDSGLMIDIMLDEEMEKEKILEMVQSVCKNHLDVNRQLSRSKRIVLYETPKYRVESFNISTPKDGEVLCGDSTECSELIQGVFTTILSDGMGSGGRAKEESGIAVDIVKKHIKNGFSNETTVQTLNSIMSLNFDENEKCNTLDMNNINMYNGEVEFIKVGAVHSFIKRGEKVEVIKSKTLPIGVLDKVELDVVKKRLVKDDIVVTISDGILDYSSKSAGEYRWVVEFLKNIDCDDIQRLGNELMKKAITLGGGKAKDDMTVIIEKICDF